MRTLLLLLLLTTCASEVISQQTIRIEPEIDGIKRKCIVYVPSQYIAGTSVPLVFMFHGTGGNGEHTYESSGWKEKAEKEGFIAVFPTARTYCMIDEEEPSGKVNTTKWIIQTVREDACPDQVLIDDIPYIRQLVDSLKLRYTIDDKRIFVSGFSNGGAFASRLAVEMSDIFSASSVSAGDLSEIDPKPIRKIPIYFILGNKDGKFLGESGYEGLPVDSSALAIPKIQNKIRKYITPFGLENSPIITQYDNAVVFRYDKPVTPDATEFTLGIVGDMTHQYPNGSNHELSASDLFWDFFMRVSQPTSHVNLDEPEQSMALYPNPAHDILMLSGVEQPQRVTIRTLTGQEKISLRPLNHTLNISLLPSGVYFLDAETESGVQTAKFIKQ